jgi:serine/threonine-protein kinase HipA
MGRDSELGATQDYGRIEYAYHLMARRAGIDMMESRLLLENGRAHFMTRRFDREDGDLRHHVQSLCAMDHLDYRKKGTNAYSQLFSVAVRLNLLYKDKEEIFRRMAFNAMVRNCDDHTKNFSFRLRQNHAWELAPAYDVTFAHNPLGEWTNRHLQSINGKFEGFQREDFLTEAERFGVGTAKRVLEQVRAAVKEWPQFAGEAGLSQVATHFIGDQLAPLE